MHQMVLSPEDARGLDLRRLTRAAMSQLERDAGTAGLPPWVAAEHRNTRHPHVHIVVAARREVSPGKYRTLQIHRDRLARMKGAVEHDLEIQRRHRHQYQVDLSRQVTGAAIGLSKDRQRETGPNRSTWLQERGDKQFRALADSMRRPRRRASREGVLMQMTSRLSRYYMREAERQAIARGYRDRWEEEQEEKRRSRARGRGD